jgi:hypothetical protein
MKMEPILPLGINKLEMINIPNKVVSGFSNLLTSSPVTSNIPLMLNDIKKSLFQNETDVRNSLTGNNGDLVEMVTSLSMTEAKLKLLIHVRDSLISSFQELLRMQI